MRSQIITAFFTVTALLAVVGALTINAFSNAEQETAADHNIKFFQYANNLGVGGHDVVAYFVDAAAAPGDARFAAEWGGQTWHFTSAKNRETFLAQPARYIPQYGGHCAYGLAQGYLVRGDPQAWTVHGGKLYLNYSNGVRTAWLADADSFIGQSELAWPKLTADPAGAR